MVGLEGSLKGVEPWDGLEGSLKIIDPWEGGIKRVLKGHGAMRWLGWRGP